MRTQFVTPEEYANAAFEIAARTDIGNGVLPDRFMRMMKENRGSINQFSPYGSSEDGLERKNPLIVALGDSVTAGHFEFTGDPLKLYAKLEEGPIDEDFAIEITDARECYLEKFRLYLIDKYEQTSVSTINSGIAGDTMYGMKNRVYRDVVRYQPDLVIINGSLNWGKECGDTNAYQKVLTETVKIIKNETKADVILLTPNMMLMPDMLLNPISSLDERVEVIRKLADAEGICLADAYKVWKAYEAAGYPVEKLLANGTNHPSTAGHELYAWVLMKLFDNQEHRSLM